MLDYVLIRTHIIRTPFECLRVYRQYPCIPSLQRAANGSACCPLGCETDSLMFGLKVTGVLGSKP